MKPEASVPLLDLSAYYGALDAQAVAELGAEPRLRPLLEETDDHALGYTMAGEGAAPPPPDLFERYRIGRFDLPGDDYTRARRETVFAPNVWPDDALPAFRPVMCDYYRAMSALARDLMRLFALTLRLPATWFDARIDREMSSLVVNHYPALSSPPLPGQMRASAHTDYGTLTIVAPSGATYGLQ